VLCVPASLAFGFSLFAPTPHPARIVSQHNLRSHISCSHHQSQIPHIMFTPSILCPTFHISIACLRLHCLLSLAPSAFSLLPSPFSLHPSSRLLSHLPHIYALAHAPSAPRTCSPCPRSGAPLRCASCTRRRGTHAWSATGCLTRPWRHSSQRRRCCGRWS